MISLLTNVYKGLRKSQSGMTLIEMAVAVAIAGVAVVSFAQFIKNMHFAETKVRARQEFERLVDRVALSLQSERTCRYAFPNVRMTSGQKTEIPEVFERNMSGTVIGSVAKKNQSIGNLITIENIEMVPTHHISTNRWIASIVVSAKLMSSDLGSADLTQRIPLFVNTDMMSNVVGCYAKPPSEGENLKQEVCSLTTDGEYYYDSVTKQCKSRYAKKCFPGNRFQAQCGDGTNLVNSDYYTCNSTIKDTSTVRFPRVYEDGVTRESRLPRPYQCDPLPDNKTVNCAYAIDLDSSSAICSACCNVDLLVNKSAEALEDAIRIDD